MTKGVHLFPSRTQKLSPYVPKIVYAKIGHCQWFFLFYKSKIKNLKKIEKYIDTKEVIWYINTCRQKKSDSNKFK